jgi:SAM-dependent methyltransferase
MGDGSTEERTSYDASTYGERVAPVYDERVASRIFDDATNQATVEALAALAAGGRVLELGIGTGRLALPLARRGLDVVGVDSSPAMVERLRAKPGGERIPIAMGDFADVDALVDGEFSLVFVAFNTFFGLLTQEDQLRCVAGVAAHLAAGGVFAVEGFVPDLARFVADQTVRVVSVEPDRVLLDVSRHDLASQRIHSQQVYLSVDRVELYPVQLRYVWPSELDLMARLSGLRLRHRWSGWRGGPFDSTSTSHVSIYELAAPS